MQKVFKLDIPFQMEILYLGALPLDRVGSQGGHLFRILSAAARKAITRRWLKPQVPTVDEWLDIVYDIFKMERITFSIRMHQSKFIKRWESWIEYITPVRSSFV